MILFFDEKYIDGSGRPLKNEIGSVTLSRYVIVNLTKITKIRNHNFILFMIR
jgi:hypothetical protein